MERIQSLIEKLYYWHQTDPDSNEGKVVKAKLDKLLKKHGMALEDIIADENPDQLTECILYYYNKNELILIVQIVAIVVEYRTSFKKLPYNIIEKVFKSHTTKLEYVDIYEMYEYYRALLHEEDAAIGNKISELKRKRKAELKSDDYHENYNARITAHSIKELQEQRKLLIKTFLNKHGLFTEHSKHSKVKSKMTQKQMNRLFKAMGRMSDSDFTRPSQHEKKLLYSRSTK